MKYLSSFFIIIVICSSVVNYVYADIKSLQKKYSGFQINNKILDGDDIIKIYNSLPAKHPFIAFDKIMKSKNAVKEVQKNCKFQNAKYNYFCRMPDGIAEILIKNNSVTKYKLTRDFQNFVFKLSEVFFKSKLSDKNQESIIDMMFDLVLTRFNDISPNNVFYLRKYKYQIVILGEL